MTDKPQAQPTETSGPERYRLRAYGRFIVRWRWLVIICSVLAIVGLTAGLGHLGYNADSRVFFSEDNPQLQALNHFENTYAKSDNLLFVVAPKDGDVFSRRAMEAIAWLTDVGWQTPFSQRVDSITNYQWTRANGDDVEFSDMYPGADSATDADLETARRVVLSQPMLANRLVNEQGSVTGVVVTLILPGNDMDEPPQVAAFARARADEFRELFPEIDLYLLGSAMFTTAFSEIPAADFQILFPGMMLLILVIIGLSVQSVWWTLLVLFSVFSTVIVAHGAAGWLGTVLSAGTTGAPIMILTLAVAHCVHIMMTCEQQLGAGLSKHDAIVESLRVNMGPVFITSATTAVGFLSLNFSDAPPFRMLGNLVAGGIMIAFVLAVTLVPAAMAALPARPRRPDRLSRRLMARFSEFVVARRAILIWATGAAILLLALGMTRITFDDDFSKYFDERFKIRVAADFTQEHLTGMNLIEYSVPAGREGGIAEPEYLAGLEQFAAWLRTQPKVRHVYLLTDVVKQLNQNMSGDDPAYYRIPENPELAAQYLLLYELSLPAGLDLNNMINVSKSATRVTVTLWETTSAELRELNRKAETWLAENLPAMQAVGTGTSLMFAHISGHNIRTMMLGSALALVLISAILIGALRSLRMGIISLVPNLFPAAMAFGLWGYLTGQIGLGVSVVAAVTLGIVVDDTVHFLSKYLRAQREHGMDALNAVRYAFNTVGMALWVTSACLVAGFLVLSLSGFKVNADMAFLCSVTIAFALAADFLFLPPLLMKLEARKT